jgi:hypothetical protein
MVASRTGALTHPMMSMSEEIFSLSILKSGPQLPKDAAIVAGSKREYLRHSLLCGALRSNPGFKPLN